MPTLTTLLTGLADRLTQYENYETQDGNFPPPSRTIPSFLAEEPSAAGADPDVQRIKLLTFRRYS